MKQEFSISVCWITHSHPNLAAGPHERDCTNRLPAILTLRREGAYPFVIVDLGQHDWSAGGIGRRLIGITEKPPLDLTSTGHPR